MHLLLEWENRWRDEPIKIVIHRQDMEVCDQRLLKMHVQQFYQLERLLYEYDHDQLQHLMFNAMGHALDIIFDVACHYEEKNDQDAGLLETLLQNRSQMSKINYRTTITSMDLYQDRFVLEFRPPIEVLKPLKWKDENRATAARSA
jgi:hypothetical protein